MTLAIMIDNGAFSSWQRGEEIRLVDYVGFLRRELKRNPPVVRQYAALDVIPGYSGIMDWSPEAVEQSARLSYDNLRIMKVAALSPIPVFHQGERFDWQRMLDDGEAYIGLSPYAKSGRIDTISWLDDCFARLKGSPQVRTHAFGVTSHLILSRFPWTSVDSTTWWRQSATGKIVRPIKIRGSYDYAVAPAVVSVTDGQLHLPGHIDRLDDLDVAFVAKFLRDVHGLDLAHARYSERMRLRTWASYYQALAAWRGIEIIPGTNPRTAIQQLVLNECGVTSRMISYYDLRTSDDVLDRYLAAEAAPALPRPGCRASGSLRRLWRTKAYLEWRALAIYTRATVKMDAEP